MTNPTTESIKREPKGEWSETMASFWSADKHAEFTAFKGGQQVHVFPAGLAGENLPAQIIQHDQPILTVADFTDAIEYGTPYDMTYTPANEPAPLVALTEKLKRRRDFADKRAAEIQEHQKDRLQKQPAHPDNATTPAEDEQPGAEINYHGGRSLGFWEGRAAALDDTLGWVDDVKPKRNPVR